MSSLISKAFLENQRALKRFLRRSFSRTQDIDDIAQETFLRAFKAETQGEIQAPKAFLFRVARNVALNELSRKTNAIIDCIEDCDASAVISDEPSLEDEAEARARLGVFAQAVSALPTQCRHAFLLRKAYGLSHKEIAERLGIAVSTVEKHVASGLLRCSDYLRRHGHEVAQRPAQGSAQGRRERNAGRG